MIRKGLILSFLLIFTLSLTGLPSQLRRGFAQGRSTVKRKVQKTNAEWSKVLTRDQYQVTRMKATEPAFSGKYAESHEPGIYACVCCDAPLFDSKTKFDSGTGWPSFYKPISNKRLDTDTDYDLGYPRTEVMCQDCGAHLGHVFDDGPAPTGLRYCMNSVALKLIPKEAAANTKTITAKAKPKAKTAAKGKSKTSAKPVDESENADETTGAPESKPKDQPKTEESPKP